MRGWCRASHASKSGSEVLMRGPRNYQSAVGGKGGPAIIKAFFLSGEKLLPPVPWLQFSIVSSKSFQPFCSLGEARVVHFVPFSDERG